MKELGCIACREQGLLRYPEIHHLNDYQHAGSARRGDSYTIPLCAWHHRGEAIEHLTTDETEELLGPSLAKAPNRFRVFFGSDNVLLEITNRLLRGRSP
jgi:hypothetical protein